MEQRHLDRTLYFQELAYTSGKYFIPFIMRHHVIVPGTRVLEIGCGEGGNLLPFAQNGCRVTGIDLSRNRIAQAREFFARHNVRVELICANIFDEGAISSTFDIIICHDVIEHIEAKRSFMGLIHRLLNIDGVVFLAFPAWYMPFGGHQQICKSLIVSKLPFIHLLPKPLYRFVLRKCGESEEMVRELLSIRDTRMTIESFEDLLEIKDWEVKERLLYLINPHYKVKFGMTPRILPKILGQIPYLRNWVSSSCLYLIARM